VDLKSLPRESMHGAQAIEKFLREAWASSALNHPNICSIYDIGGHEDHSFLVMELFKGQTRTRRARLNYLRKIASRT
jgi:eukaryotic-like serine/threonine-protein kinase